MNRKLSPLTLIVIMVVATIYTYFVYQYGKLDGYSEGFVRRGEIMFGDTNE